jgi:hypothetical protein
MLRSRLSDKAASDRSATSFDWGAISVMFLRCAQGVTGDRGNCWRGYALAKRLADLRLPQTGRRRHASLIVMVLMSVFFVTAVGPPGPGANG